MQCQTFGDARRFGDVKRWFLAIRVHKESGNGIFCAPQPPGGEAIAHIPEGPFGQPCMGLTMSRIKSGPLESQHEFPWTKGCLGSLSLLKK